MSNRLIDILEDDKKMTDLQKFVKNIESFVLKGDICNYSYWFKCYVQHIDFEMKD